MEVKNYYAGIGSRRTPLTVQREMEEIAKVLARMGYVLRSGHGGYADLAFERGSDVAGGSKEIFLPWARFGESYSQLYPPDPVAYDLAKDFHPNWDNLTAPAQALIARNGQQVLGKQLLSPVRFVVCWTPDGCTTQETRTQETGGTGQAIAIASEYGIPVFNLKNESDSKTLWDLLGQSYERH